MRKKTIHHAKRGGNYTHCALPKAQHDWLGSVSGVTCVRCLLNVLVEAQQDVKHATRQIALVTGVIKK